MYKTILFIILLLAGYLRFNNLDSHNLWIDECLYVGMFKDNSIQEFVPQIFSSITGVGNDFGVRCPFALFSTLTVLTIYYVIKDKKMALALAFVYATLPLFVWWGRMARPYCIAGFFMVLAWKHPAWMIAAIFCTPVSLIGINLTKLKDNWKWYVGFIVLSLALYFLRTDYARGHWNIQTIFNSSRWFYLPLLACMLYIGRFLGSIGKPINHKR